MVNRIIILKSYRLNRTVLHLLQFIYFISVLLIFSKIISTGELQENNEALIMAISTLSVCTFNLKDKKPDPENNRKKIALTGKCLYCCFLLITIKEL